MDREAADRWIERAILGLVVAIIGFGTLAFGGVRPQEFVVLWWLVVGALGLWVIRIWIAPSYRFLWPPLCWAILPFVGYAIWRYHVADIRYLAWQELIQVLLGAILLLIVVNNLYTQESTRIISLSVAALGMVIAMYGIYQWLTNTEKVWFFDRAATYTNRASGTYVCPNHFAGFLEMILPLSVSMAILGRIHILTRIGLVYASLVMLVGLVASQSRAAWLAGSLSLVLLLLFLFASKRQRWVALIALASLLSAGYWFYSRSVAPRFAGTEFQGHNQEIRLRLWSAAWNVWKENPLLGVGADHFDFRYRKYREAIDKTQTRPGRVHNDYLNTLVDYGAIGLFFALLPVGIAIWSVVRSWPHLQRSGNDFGQKRSNRAAIVLGASAGLVALLAHSFVDFNMHIPANAFLAAVLLAIIASHIRFATERFWITARLPWALAGSAAILGCLYYLVPQAIKRTAEVSLLSRAEKLEAGSEVKIALMRRAFEIQPRNFETAFAIGEQYRSLAVAGEDQNRTYALEAVTWFQRAIDLNKWEVVARLHLGMCLDWIGEQDKATTYFTEALQLDPNYWYTRGMMGWHEFQRENYGAAREWFWNSLRVNWTANPLASTYFPLTEKKLREAQEPAARP